MAAAKQGGAAPVLTTRALNRALLARQLLLERAGLKPLAVVERLAGMQAQVPRPPFGGLWARIAGFQADDLLRLYLEKKVVRATAMRGTIHLLSARDYLRFRPALAPVLAAGAQSVASRRVASGDLDLLHRRGRDFFRTAAPFDDFRVAIEAEHPGKDIRAMAYSVRMNVPLVMVPGGERWAFSNNAAFVLAEQWLGAKVPQEAALDTLVLRYLAAFGPATPADAQSWSGLRGLRDTFEALRPTLAIFRDDRKRELFDLPDAPRPDPDTPAPVRFLPEYDNILLAHADRARIAADADRKRLTTKNLQVLGCVLVDGFVAGSWRMEEKKAAATLTVTQFARLAKPARAAVEAEGDAMLRFYAPGVAARTVAFAV